MHKAYVIYICKHTFAEHLKIKYDLYNSFFKNKLDRIKDEKYI